MRAGESFLARLGQISRCKHIKYSTLGCGVPHPGGAAFFGKKHGTAEKFGLPVLFPTPFWGSGGDKGGEIGYDKIVKLSKNAWIAMAGTTNKNAGKKDER